MNARSGILYAAVLMFGLAVSGLYFALAFNYSVEFVRGAFLWVSIPGFLCCLALARRWPRQTGLGYAVFLLGSALGFVFLGKMLPPLTEVFVDIAPHLILIAIGLGVGTALSRLARAKQKA